MEDNWNELNVLETYGAHRKRSYKFHLTRNYVFVDDDFKRLKSFGTFFREIFLPYGYPDSVSKDYLQYQIWDSLQAFASSITGGLCTHAILKGVGVGNENASPIAATITWLLKDGSSMIGRIGFAWLQGTKLDSDCKKWRLFADVVNDAAMFLDLISGYFQDFFLPIVCVSGVLKAIVGVAGGCTRAALTQHQARKNNMADVSAKDGSQETLVNLCALLCNLVLIPLISENSLFIWFLFIIMTSVHLMANYLAVKSVVMETFNEDRFKIYVHHYLSEGLSGKKFLSVDQVNSKENVLLIHSASSSCIHLGASFSEIIQSKRHEDICQLMNIYKSCNYILSYSRRNMKDLISIVLNKRATTETQIEALFQACYISHLIQQKSPLFVSDDSAVSLEALSREFTENMFQDFMYSLQMMNFNTKTVLFNCNLWRADW
ncbi:RUS family member 1 [Parasteatoda tepidariorum]|uniref:RUS family member 1 n=1 Tax=Parasteatoda tepidariorum TaxID=114398 RepID=UPI0039BCB006